MPLQAVCANWVDLLERATSAIVGGVGCNQASILASLTSKRVSL